MIKRNNKGQFITTRGNQFAKGNKPNKTSFDGSQTGEKHPSWKGGNQKHKDCIYQYVGNQKRIRRGRKIYEEAFGKIPKSYVIYHKDGNCYNDDLDNLEAVSRKELLLRNQNKNKRV